MTTLNEAAAKLAAIKLASDIVRTAERETKAELEQHLTPGDRKIATAPNGEQIATITRAAVKETTELAVTDETKLIAWLKAHDNGDGIRTIETVADWKIADLLAAAERTGELPDGVEPVTRTSGGYITVRQTPEQKTALIAHHDLITDILTPKEIEQ